MESVVQLFSIFWCCMLCNLNVHLWQILKLTTMKTKTIVRFEVLMVVTVCITVFWDVTPCSLVCRDTHVCLKGTLCHHLGIPFEHSAMITRTAYTCSEGNIFEKPRFKWEDNIKMDMREIGCHVEWILLTHCRSHRWTVVKLTRTLCCIKSWPAEQVLIWQTGLCHVRLVKKGTFLSIKGKEGLKWVHYRYLYISLQWHL